MAFTPETFSPLGANSSEGLSVYKYQTEDTLLDITSAGYFSDKELQLKEDDVILVVAESNTTAMLRVSSDTATADPDISGSTGAVDSVFGRTGSVVAQSGDYNTDQVTEGGSNLYFTEARVQAVPDVANAEQVTNKNAANGYAGLSSGKLDISVIPNSVIGGIKVVGFWNANTNTPNLSSLTLGQGEAYQVDANGSTNLNGETNWRVRDLAVWDDGLSGNWFKIDNTDDVLSVHGRTGAISSSVGDYDTDEVTEASNLYYTDARVNANPNVSANTASRHNPVTLNADAKTQSLLSLTGQELQVSSGWRKTIFSSYKVGTTADPSTTAETPATAPVLAEMTHTFTPAKATNLIKVECGCSFDKTGGGDDGVRMAVFVDGVIQTETTRRDFVGSSDDYDTFLHTFWRGSLSVAAHTIDVRFWGTDDTMVAVDVERNFYIEEIETI